MSTYHPKTLRRWKVHKRSLIDLMDKALPGQQNENSKSQVIHSLELEGGEREGGRSIRKERYRLQETRSQNVHLTNGFRRVRREVSGTAFSKVVSEEHSIRVDFASQQKNTQKGALNACLPRMAPKRRQLLLIRTHSKKIIASHSLSDLLQVRQSAQVEPAQILKTDGEAVDLELLQKETFSPYRACKDQKSEEVGTIVQKARPILMRRGKREDLTSQVIPNFMYISEIDLKNKQLKGGMRLLCAKRRSFSLLDMARCIKNQKIQGCTAGRYNRKILNTEIEPWQTDK